MKAKILNKIAYLWDALFTAVDCWQLKVWMRIIAMRDSQMEKDLRERLQAPIPEKLNNIKPLDSWEEEKWKD